MVAAGATSYVYLTNINTQEVFKYNNLKEAQDFLEV